MRIFVNMSDNGNLVISHMIHRALPDTYLKIKPYQDFKHREKSKVNLPRTQKVGAEKGDSEPTGSPGTLTPNAHRHTRRLPGTTPWETLRGYTLANRMWPPWSLQFNGFLHGETEGKDNRVRCPWAAPEAMSPVCYCAAKTGEVRKTDFQHWNRPPPSFMVDRTYTLTP